MTNTGEVLCLNPMGGLLVTRRTTNIAGGCSNFRYVSPKVWAPYLFQNPWYLSELAGRMKIWCIRRMLQSFRRILKNKTEETVILGGDAWRHYRLSIILLIGRGQWSEWSECLLWSATNQRLPFYHFVSNLELILFYFILVWRNT